MANDKVTNTSRITALVNALTEPIGTGEAWKRWGRKETGTRNANLLSIALSACWNQRLISKVVNTKGGPAKWLYAPANFPGAVMFDGAQPKVHRKRKGRTVKPDAQVVPYAGPQPGPVKKGREVPPDKVVQAEFIPRTVRQMPDDLRATPSRSEPVEIRVGGKIITIRDE